MNERAYFCTPCSKTLQDAAKTGATASQKSPNISQGTVATFNIWWIVNDNFITNILWSLNVKDCWKSIRMWRLLHARLLWHIFQLTEADGFFASTRCSSGQTLDNERCYIGWSDVTVICGHNTISMLWGNTAYCVKLSGEDLSRCSNKTELDGLRKCPYYHYFTKKVMSQ